MPRTSILTSGHPSRRTRKRVLLRMRSEIVETNEAAATAALILRSMRAQHACVSKDGPTQTSCMRMPSSVIESLHPATAGIYVTTSSMRTKPAGQRPSGRPKLAPGMTVSSMDGTTSMESMRRHVIYANGPRIPFPTGPLNQSCRRRPFVGCVTKTITIAR